MAELDELAKSYNLPLFRIKYLHKIKKCPILGILSNTDHTFLLISMKWRKTLIQILNCEIVRFVPAEITHGRVQPVRMRVYGARVLLCVLAASAAEDRSPPGLGSFSRKKHVMRRRLGLPRARIFSFKASYCYKFKKSEILRDSNTLIKNFRQFKNRNVHT